jgi:hypothetical protein
MKRKARKPFSELTAAEQIREARAAIKQLRHPHNRYMYGIHDAIKRWHDVLVRLGATED